ncbi:MAG: Rrf2 family transcriptional regulator [Deltaproteobacteria bacterium]|nr:Rrf2 family transcriptional regulator [Deltaproteobacteria bacterium]MBW2566000.1 Rrf2 family transcriptional regulator [Deltaproteobacteria bacterium]
MKLSTRSRYGTRMMLDMAQHCNEGPIQLGEIARRVDVSVKYLEQLIIPLKKADYVKSLRGAKGGHMLNRAPDEITVGEIVDVLEGGINLTDCVGNPETCEKHQDCLTRSIWEEATKAIYEKLNSITLAQIIDCDKKV